MGMGPKTKAECDREIARAEENLAWRKSQYEKMKAAPLIPGKNGGYTREGIAAAKAAVETAKGKVKSLKALRKTLK